MKLFSLLVLLLAVGGCLSSISNINLSPTGNFAKLSTKQGLWTSVVLLQFLILGQLGVIPYKFKGRKKRDLDPQALVQESNAMLKVMYLDFFYGGEFIICFLRYWISFQLIRSLDHRDCLLRYLCELEAARIETKNTGVALDADVESDMILLNIAK